MRALRHLLLALVVLVLLLAGGLAFVLYDPLSSSPRFLRPDQLITASPGDAVAAMIGGERPIQETDSPARAALALRYQPTLVVSGYDRNWPVSVLRLLGSRWDGHSACVYVHDRCKFAHPTAAALDGLGARSDYVRYPSPIDSAQDTFDSASAALGMASALIRQWPGDLRKLDPFQAAEIYFYYLKKTRRGAYPGTPPGLVSLEYWFYYPLNYFPLVRIPLQALSSPIASTVGNTDYHQGDWEHVAVLLDPKTMRPLYLWMARHAGEGVAYRWHSSSVQWRGDHATVYAALGSHASYAHCGIQRRSRTYWFVNDYVVCKPGRTFGFTPSATPLVDLAKTSWGCWRGHFGQAGRGLHIGTIGFVPYEAAGPLSPLYQQENFRIACRVPPGTPKPPAPL